MSLVDRSEAIHASFIIHARSYRTLGQLGLGTGSCLNAATYFAQARLGSHPGWFHGVNACCETQARSHGESREYNEF